MLSIGLQEYEEMKAAQMEVGLLNKKYQGQQVQGIGDEAIFFLAGQRKNDFVVRKGRFVFRLGMGDFRKSLNSNDVNNNYRLLPRMWFND